MPHLLRFFFGSLGLLILWLAGPRPAQAQNPDWQNVAATAGAVQVAASATDGNGNVYLAGSFTGTATFGSTTLAASTQELFVAKWDATTGFVWALQGMSTGTTATTYGATAPVLTYSWPAVLAALR